VDARSTDIGALHILSRASLQIKYPANLLLHGPVIIDTAATLDIRTNCIATLDDLLLNGSLLVQSNNAPQFICRGALHIAPWATYVPGNSNFAFRNPNATVVLPSLSYYDLTVDSTSGATTSGNISVAHQLWVNAPVMMRPQDTITVSLGDTAALQGTGQITRGTIVQTITSSIALGGGSFRFFDPLTTMKFYSDGTLPTQITMTSYPDAYPRNLDTTKIFRHYYDIHQTGGSAFRLRLAFQYDPNEAGVPAPTDGYSIYRSPDYGTTWIEIPASSFDSVNHVIAADTITGFSRYSFGRKQAAEVVAVHEEVQRVTGFALSQNYPNPFNPSTRISYSIGRSDMVSLKVYDLLGKAVATLVNSRKEPGNYVVTWDASAFPSGMYIFQLVTSRYRDSKKLLILK
jgi:hypothetical protein